MGVIEIRKVKRGLHILVRSLRAGPVGGPWRRRLDTFVGLTGMPVRRNIVDMKTLSATQARTNLSLWLKRAAAGEDIGILCGDRIIGLRPVEVQSVDYALREYALSPAALEAWTRRMDHEIEEERSKGKTRRYTGNLEADVRD